MGRPGLLWKQFRGAALPPWGRRLCWRSRSREAATIVGRQRLVVTLLVGLAIAAASGLRGLWGGTFGGPEFFRVLPGGEENVITLRVLNISSFFQLGLTEVTVAGKPSFVGATSVKPPTLFPQLLHRSESGQAKVRFDVHRTAPVGETGTLGVLRSRAACIPVAAVEARR